MSYTPPKSVQKAAALGLELRRKYGRGGLTNKQASEQGIGSGVQRAVNLKNGDALTLDTVRRMKAFFDRHRVYKEKGYHDSRDSASYISWLLWGGDPGYEWAKDIIAKQQEESVMIPQLIHDLEDLLDREKDDRRMVSSALEQAGRAAADILAIIAQAEDGSIDSWMEYKIYRAADALRAVRDSLDVKKN
jgi:hypothetical protein